MNASNLLVELFVEELPPKALQKLGDAFAAVIFEQLKAQGLLASTESRLTAYASPRRLAVHITEVLPQAEDKAVSQKLMPVSVALDAEGKPTAALLKLAALGADESAVAALKRQGEGKAEALFYESTAKGVLLTDGVQKRWTKRWPSCPSPRSCATSCRTAGPACTLCARPTAWS
jgi:glycyl-tRNA synthetase beta chain